MKVKNRKYTLGVRLKDHERKFLEREATEKGQRVSDYVRRVLFANMPSLQNIDGKINA